MPAKIISKPEVPVEPLFLTKGHGWLTAKEIAERFYDPHDQHKLNCWIVPDKVALDPKVVMAVEEYEVLKAKAEAKAKWDRNKAEAAKRSRKMR